MKKIIVISSLMATFASISTFGQGYFQFVAGKSQVWDGFTLGNVSQRATTVNVAFLWGPNGNVPLVDAILPAVPANATALNSTWSTAAAWTDILIDPNFTLAFDNNTSAMAVTRSLSNGAINYD